jgi:hypothetical protein
LLVGHKLFIVKLPVLGDLLVRLKPPVVPFGDLIVLRTFNIPVVSNVTVFEFEDKLKLPTELKVVVPPPDIFNAPTELKLEATALVKSMSPEKEVNVATLVGAPVLPKYFIAASAALIVAFAASEKTKLSNVGKFSRGGA